jgi:hypothetical protein
MRRRRPSLSLSNLRWANLCFEQDEFFNGIGGIAGVQRSQGTLGVRPERLFVTTHFKVAEGIATFKADL